MIKLPKVHTARTSIVVAALVALAVPASASATDRFVSTTGTDNATCSAAAKCRTVQHAVDVALTDDRVLVGPGTYEHAEAIRHVDIVGSGSGTQSSFDPATQTQMLSSLTAPAVRMLHGGAVRSMRLTGQGGNTAPAVGTISLEAAGPTPGHATDPYSYEVSDVVAFGDANDSSSLRSALSVTDAGVLVTSPLIPVKVDVVRSTLFGASLRNGGINYDAPAIYLSTANSAFPGLDVDIADSTIDRSSSSTGSGTGVLALAGATNQSHIDLHLARDVVQNVETGLNLLENTRAKIERTRVLAGQQGVMFSVNRKNTGDVRVADSLISVKKTLGSQFLGGIVAKASGPGTGGGVNQVQVFGSTIVGDTVPGVSVVSSSSEPPPTVGLVNSIARQTSTTAAGVKFEVTAGVPASVAADHSSVSGVTGQGLTAVYTAVDPANINPAFVSEAAFDFHLTPASALVDAGDPGRVAAGELDLDGNPRSLDGNGDCVAVPDVGAFELTGHAGPGCPQLGGGTQGQNQQGNTAGKNPLPTLSKASLLRKRFVPGKARKRGSKGTFIRFTLSEAAKVKFTVQRRRAHSRKYKTAGSFTKKGKKGKNSVAFAGTFKRKGLKPGSYRIVLQATDSVTRKKSATKTLKFAVKP